MDRAEYVAWCKARALEYWEEGDLTSATTSMASDMNKRDDTRVPGALLGLALLYLVDRDAGAVRRWIEGFR